MPLHSPVVANEKQAGEMHAASTLPRLMASSVGSPSAGRPALRSARADRSKSKMTIEFPVLLANGSGAARAGACWFAPLVDIAGEFRPPRCQCVRISRADQLHGGGGRAHLASWIIIGDTSRGASARVLGVDSGRSFARRSAKSANALPGVEVFRDSGLDRSLPFAGADRRSRRDVAMPGSLVLRGRHRDVNLRSAR